MTIPDEERKNSTHSDRWMIHVHVYNTLTDPNRGHQHGLIGVCCPARYRRKFHVHRLNSRTTFSGSDSIEEHWHSYDFWTDIEVEMPDGTHVHYFAGETSTNAGHSHTFTGALSLAPDSGFESELGKYKYKKCNRPEDDENQNSEILKQAKIEY